jgi:hypothetical protein
VAALAALASAASAQPNERRARIVGGGDRDRGKCTIEVVVDGSAEVEIRGDFAALRNLAGQPPEWRRFECSSPMPPNPANFRFIGVDGRGRQQLVREPRGGPAVIRIEDPQSGREGYTFDVTWDGSFNPGPGPGGPPASFRRFTADQAVAICQDSVRQQARVRFGDARVEFRNVRMDDNPGRNDWVVGAIDVLGRRNPAEEHMRFACSVNFDTGQVRSVDLQPMDGGFRGGPDRGAENRAFENCQQAVRARLLRERDGRVEFQSVRIDDNPGRNDWVIGTVRTDRGRGWEYFNYSCSVNLRDGDVRSADVTRR